MSTTETKETIQVSEDGFKLPTEEVLTGRGFITGKSGSGKSNTASVVIEELLDDGFAVLIVDTDGEYYGLKEEYEILHVGADEECDIQVGVEHAEKLANLVLNGVPIILDVSGYIEEDEARAVVRETARQLFTKEKKQKSPLPIFVEEIHEYIPQTGGVDETGKMLVKVAKRGRKHGLGIVGISQRPANVQKDFITQASWLVWHRLTWDNDTDVVRRVVGQEQSEAVEELKDGEAFVQADFLDEIERVQFRRKRTFDAGATPGLEDFERPELKSVSGDLVEELEEISEQKRREQDRIAELETKLEQRDERIQELEEELDRAEDMRDMAEQFTDALTSSGGDASEAIGEEIDEIREEKNERIRELEDENAELREQLQDARERISELEEYEELADVRDELREKRDELMEIHARLGDTLGVENGGDSEKWRERAENLQEKVEEKEREIEELRSGDAPAGNELAELIEHDAVQKAIEIAQEESDHSDRHFHRALAVLASSEGGLLSAADIEPMMEVSESSVRGVLNGLYNIGVVKRDGNSNSGYEYSLDRDFLEKRVRVSQLEGA